MEPANGQLLLHLEGWGEPPVSATHLVFNILSHAAVTTLWTAEDMLIERFLDNTRAIVRRLENWAVDKTTTFETIQAIGLYNLYLKPGVTVDLKSYGRLCAAPHRPEMPQTFMNGSLVLTLPSGPWPYAPSAMLVRKAEIGATLVVEPSTSLGQSPFGDLSEVIERVALATVLAAGHYQHSAPVYGGESSSHPLGGGAGGSARPRNGPKDPGIPLPGSTGAKVKVYLDRIKDLPEESPLLFAGRRLVSALNAAGTQDALVDSVVAWEALFSATPETTFLVTAAVARTLAPEFKDEVTLVDFQQRLQKIYAARSNIVHGNAAAVKKDRTKLAEYTLNAKRYSWRLLRRVMLWPTEVITMETSKRAKMAILDPDWPPDLADFMKAEN